MKDLLTLSEVSTFLKVPKSTIYKLARERRLPGHKVGKHWRFVREEIEAWVQNAAHSLPDLWRVVDGKRPLQQRHPHHD